MISKLEYQTTYNKAINGDIEAQREMVTACSFMHLWGYDIEDSSRQAEMWARMCAARGHAEDILILIDALIVRYDCEVMIDRQDRAGRYHVEMTALADLLADTGDDTGYENIALNCDRPTHEVMRLASDLRKSWDGEGVTLITITQGVVDA